MGTRTKATEIVIDKPGVELLSNEEKKAYQQALKSDAPLSVETSLRLFEQFLQGKTCAQIAQYNPGFTLGAIVRARVDYNWDKRKDDYIDKLYCDTTERLKQTALESVNFIGDMMAATHKFHGEKIRRYLATGNVKDLPEDFTIQSVKDYKSIIETLLKISGAENKKEIKKEVTYKGEVKTTKELSIPQLTDKISGSDAARLLELVDEENG